MEKKTRNYIIVLSSLVLLIAIISIADVVNKGYRIDDNAPQIARQMAASEEAHPYHPTSAWSIHEEKDEMTSVTNYFASIDADNTLNLSGTYDGEVRATLIIRNDRRGDNVILTIPKGQFHSHDIYTHHVRVRFDDEKPLRINYLTAADGSFNNIFLKSESLLISKMKKAKFMKIEAQFFQCGVQTMTFHVEGFKWEQKI